MQEGASHIADKSQQELVAALQANNESVMKALYLTNYPKVKAYVLQNSGSVPEAKDVYQEAFVAVWKNVREGKFIPESESSLSGYLYRIAKNKWIDHLRSPQHAKTVSDSKLRIVPIHDEEKEKEILQLEKENIQTVMNAFQQLGGECKNVLKQFYFRRKTYREIAGELEMEEASVRNKKYRCMLKLKEMVKNSNSQK